VWARDDAGKLAFVNQAYARAVEAKDAAEAVERGIELFDRGGRGEILRAHERAESYAGRLPAVVAGQRRSFDVVTVPAARGSAGIGIDSTEAELMRAELARMMDAHRRTLDQLATGVAIFGSNQRLSFYNAAYRMLWDLEEGFLDDTPTDSAVLDQLRAARMLPDQSDYRQWKAALFEAYRAIEAKEEMWHLPDGRTLWWSPRPIPRASDLSRRRHRAARSRAALRCADPGAGRDAGQPD
jgi:PAS domain-containing protein